VVIDTSDHGESDRIVTFYTQATGKLVGIAKGAKRSKKRFLNRLEPFSLVEILYTPGRASDLVRVEQAELLSSYPSLRHHYPAFTAATVIARLVRDWSRENDPDPELFRLLLWSLDSMEEAADLRLVMVLFLAKLLTLSGYRPDLLSCRCSATLDVRFSPYHFSCQRKTLLCGRCTQGQEQSLVPVSLPTVKLLALACELPVDKLDRLHFNMASLREALTLLARYEQHLLQRENPAWKAFFQLHHQPRPCLR